MRFFSGSKLWWVAGCVSFLLALVITAPASLMEWLLPKLSKNTLQLYGTQGSFWQGNATNLVVNLPEAGPQQVGQLKWELLLLPILRGELSAKLTVRNGLKLSHGVIGRTPGGYCLREVEANLPIAVFTGFFPATQLWRLDGTLFLQTQYLELSSRSIHGNASLRWENAASGLSKVKPLGQYQLSVNDEKLQLTTLSGIMQLSGSGEMNQHGLKFAGTAQAAQANKAELADFMHLLGREDQQGVVRFSVSQVRQ